MKELKGKLILKSMKYCFLFAIFLVSILFTSCITHRYIYSASPANNPYLTKKGNAEVTGYYSSDGNSNPPKEYARGIDLHGGYAVGNHWAIITGYFNRRERDINTESSSNNSFISYKRNLIDIGTGYFTSLDKSKELYFNFYGGYAAGKFSFEEDNYSRYHESVIHKWFLQPGLNFISKKYFRMSFAGKISFVHYGDIKTTYTSQELTNYGLDRIADKTICFFEPSFNIQFGTRKIPWAKIVFLMSGTSNYQPANTYLDVRGSNVSLGLSFDFFKHATEK